MYTVPDDVRKFGITFHSKITYYLYKNHIYKVSTIVDRVEDILTQEEA